jgi:hypothetical protein
LPHGAKATLVLVNSTRPIISGKSPVEYQIEFKATCRTAVAIIGAHPGNRFWRCHTAPVTGDFNGIIVVKKREAWPGFGSLLGDNINQRIGLRYFFRVDHSLLIGFDRYRRGILGLISNQAYLGFHHENLSWIYGANCRHLGTPSFLKIATVGSYLVKTFG